MLLYRHSFALKHLVPATLFFILATLLKPTDGGLIWLSVTAAVFVELMVQKSYKKLPMLLGSSLLVALCICLWYLFVKAYNAENGNTINLQGIWPIWQMTAYDIADTIKYRIFDLGPKVFQHVSLLFLLVGFLIVYVVKWKALDHFLKLFTLMLMLGSVIYAVLWYRAFFIHDYYQLIFAIPAVSLGITVLAYYSEVIATRLGRPVRYAINAVLAGFMLISIYYNQYIQIDSYSDANVGFRNITAIYELEPYLRKIGITPDDIILSVPDGSPNITLAAYGNKGYACDLFGAGTYRPDFVKDLNVSYMIIHDSIYMHDPLYQPYTSKLIGKYKGIHIYDIRQGRGN